MNKKLLLYALLTFTSVGMLFSQPKFHVGAMTTINSTFVLDKGLSEDPRYNSEFTYNVAPIGLSTGLDLTRGFGLSLEGLIANAGQVYNIVDKIGNVVGERNIDLKQLQLPMFIRFLNKSSAGTRANFSFGPQLNLLLDGIETEQYSAHDMVVPDGVEPPAGATLNPDGTYHVEAEPTTELLKKNAANKLESFKNQEVAISAAFGLDFDISKNFFINSNIRATYSLTDMRNEDLINQLKSGASVQELFGNRANLLIGIQLGLHFMVGGTRSFL